LPNTVWERKLYLNKFGAIIAWRGNKYETLDA